MENFFFSTLIAKNDLKISSLNFEVEVGREMG